MTAVLSVLTFVVLLEAAGAAAADCTPEREPNDLPDAAAELNACVQGALSSDDSQDLWRWQVREGEVRHVLTLLAAEASLQKLALMRVNFDAQNRVSGTEPLLEFSKPPGQAQSSSEPLLLSPGTYYVGIAGGGNYQLRRTEQTLPERTEAEPNDQRQQAMPLEDAFELSGTGDSDHFSWTLTEAAAGQRFSLSLTTPFEGSYALNLLTGPNQVLAARIGASGVAAVHDLGLPAGTYDISLQALGDAKGSPYVLSAAPLGARRPELEEEPNGRRRPYPIGDSVTGRLEGPSAEGDYYSLSRRDAASRHSIVLTTASSERRRVCLQSLSLRDVLCREGTGRVVLSEVDLGAERLLRVGGAADPRNPYRITIESDGAFRGNREREPNDGWWSAAPLAESNAIRGHFDGADRDFYRLVTSGEPQYWRIQAMGEGLRQLVVHNAKGDPVAQRTAVRGPVARLSEIYLMPGTHYIGVQGEDGDYLLRAIAQGPPDPSREMEPNDEAISALRLDFGKPRHGVLTYGDRDFYRFRLQSEERIAISARPPEDAALRLQFMGSDTGLSVPQGAVGREVRFEAVMLPGDHVLSLASPGGSEDAYEIELTRMPEATLDTGVSAELDLRAGEVAAFSQWQQTVPGTLRLANSSADDVTVQLQAATSIPLARLALDRSRVEVPAAEARSVGASLTLPQDLWSTTAVHVSVAASLDEGTAARATAEVIPREGASPVGAHFAFPVPEPLQGAINVAELGLGAEPVEPPARSNQQDLHSLLGFPVQQRFRLLLAQSPLPQTLTVRLAPHSGPVIGLALHPGTGSRTEGARTRLKAFELRLSEDGRSYETALSGTLSASPSEQFFVLDRPHRARFARLLLSSTHGSEREIGLGGWKVLVAPDGLEQPPDLASPDLGGHLVRHDLPSGADFDFAAHEASPLVPGKRIWPLLCRSDCRNGTFVVGFHALRIAELSRIEWQDAAAAQDALPVVEVDVSARSPVGPWRRVGTLPPNDSGTRSLSFTSPVAARYVRFVIPVTAPLNSAMPDVVRVIERSADDEYRSILGEWGWYARQTNQVPQSPPDRAPLEGLPESDRGDLPRSVSGTVSVGEREERFGLTVPAQSNRIRFLLKGAPALPTLELSDAGGNLIPVLPADDKAGPGEHQLRAAVRPGERYRLRVLEAPRSVIFAWDTSGSVAPFRPMIYRALERFAAGVVPGREVVNLMPFEHGLLLDDWESEPTLIWQAMQNFYRSSESSQTALTLLNATERLADRKGSRSIVVIGDMDQHWVESRALWQALDAVQPNVHLFQVAQPSPRSSYAVLPNWAQVNLGGWYLTPSITDLEIGFQQVAARIRQPIRYALETGYEYLEPPGPGRLRVVSDLVERDDGTEQIALGSMAVQVILDASGSMLQRIGGNRRIDIAKQTLIDMIRRSLPAGTPFALRVFGHLEGNYSCRTDLAAPLAPLQREEMETLVREIEAQNLAATPIAASLARVGEDLAGADGGRMVVLLTDGEETCDGDPAAEIERLRQAGLDVRINIVGFAIDDQALKAEFTDWAARGGGRYFDAGSADELQQAMLQAFRLPFRVLDSRGGEVGRGVVNDDGIELEEGEYSVEVFATPLRRYEDVVITGDKEARLVVH